MSEGNREGPTDGTEYAAFLKAHYLRLSAERSKGGRLVGFEEVKLRLFLTLLQPPECKTAALR